MNTEVLLKAYVYKLVEMKRYQNDIEKLKCKCFFDVDNLIYAQYRFVYTKKKYFIHLLL